LANNDNIWQAAKYLKSGNESAFRKVLQLVKLYGITTADYIEQAEELLAKFFPLLLDNIDDKSTKLYRAPIVILTITLEEVERQLFIVKL
jgi:hypothetical protein